MTIANKNEAIQALKQVFNLTKVKRVVFVDDEYRIGFEEVFGLYATVSQEKLVAIDYLKDITATEDYDLKRERLKQLWDKLGDADKYYIYSKLSEVAKSAGAKEEAVSGTVESANRLDMMAIPLIRDIFNIELKVDFRELSFTEWKTESPNLVNELKTTKTIFLFDQDLSKDGGSDKEGISLVQYTLGKTADQQNQVICGLLSHTFTPDEAYDLWKKLASENGIDEGRFILIPKEYLSTNLLGFVHMFKLMMLNKPCSELIARVSSLIGQAHKLAKKSIERINVFDFDRIVFRSSHREGVWEPDTLFRLFGIFQRDFVRDLARNDEKTNVLTSRVREVSSIASNPIASYCGKSWEIQRSELYEKGDHINKLHMPVELGDIFQKTNGTKKYILIAQPCDLMMRLEDESAGKRRPNMHEVTLADIIPDAPDDPRARYELLFFDEATGKPYYVAFRSTHTVSLLVLDLCVYQDDGLSKFPVNHKCPENVIPAWRLHHKKVHDSVDKEIRPYLELKAKIRDGQHLDLLLPRSSNDNVFKAKIDDSAKDNEVLSYSCRRVGRLCEPRASAMLTAYASYVSRAAFEHDFAEIPKS